MATGNRTGLDAAGVANIGDNPRILAFDLGQKCGVACFEDGELKNISLWNFDADRRASLGSKYLAFKEKLEAEVRYAEAQNKPLHFVYEAVDFVPKKNGAYSAHAWGAMEGVLHMVADSHNIPVTGLNVMTIKAVGAGSGRATKEEMRIQARLTWPGFRWGEDQADAAMAGWAYIQGATSKSAKHA